ncbi:MAG: hypothetical protein K8R36_14450 [Planctomycetales bacterium]|nr:hypothetical protein [Planctomycetales bacterium]
MVVSIFRSIGAVIAGLAVALFLIVAVEGISAVIHPFPPGVDPSDYELCQAHVANYPQWLLGIVVVLWGMTALVSSWLATRLGTKRHSAHGKVVGFFLFLPMIANVAMLPYPVWFGLFNMVAIPLATILGTMLGRGTIFGPRLPSDPTA